MFSSVHQTGTQGVEILTPSGTGKEQKYAAFQGGVTRSYERDIKGYCYSIPRGSSPAASIQCPAFARDSLGVVQPLLFLQILCEEGAATSIEATVADARGQRHRLHFASSFQKLESNELHAQIPWAWAGAPCGRWFSAVLDLRAWTARCFRGAEFASLEGFCLKPALKLRKVFTMPAGGSADYFDDETGQLAFLVPAALAFPRGVEAALRVLRAPPAAAAAAAAEVEGGASACSASSVGRQAGRALAVKGVGFGAAAQRKLMPEQMGKRRGGAKGLQAAPVSGPGGGSASPLEKLPESRPRAALPAQKQPMVTSRTSREGGSSSKGKSPALLEQEQGAGPENCVQPPNALPPPSPPAATAAKVLAVTCPNTRYSRDEEEEEEEDVLLQTATLKLRPAPAPAELVSVFTALPTALSAVTCPNTRYSRDEEEEEEEDVLLQTATLKLQPAPAPAELVSVFTALPAAPAEQCSSDGSCGGEDALELAQHLNVACPAAPAEADAESERRVRLLLQKIQLANQGLTAVEREFREEFGDLEGSAEEGSLDLDLDLHAGDSGPNPWRGGA